MKCRTCSDRGVVFSFTGESSVMQCPECRRIPGLYIEWTDEEWAAGVARIRNDVDSMWLMVPSEWLDDVDVATTTVGDILQAHIPTHYTFADVLRFVDQMLRFRMTDNALRCPLCQGDGWDAEQELQNFAMFKKIRELVE